MNPGDLLRFENAAPSCLPVLQDGERFREFFVRLSHGRALASFLCRSSTSI